MKRLFTLFGPLSVTLGLLAAQAGEAQSPVSTACRFVSLERTVQEMRQSQKQREACSAQAPLEASLRVKQAPVLNAPAELILTVLSQEDLGNVEITWELSPGTVPVAGARQQGGVRIPANRATTFPLSVQFPKPGLWEVAVSVIERRPGYAQGRRVSLHFEVTAQGIQVHAQRPWKEPQEGRKTRDRLPGEVIAPAPGLTPASNVKVPTINKTPISDDKRVRGPAGTARIRGRFFYRHNNGTLRGAANSVMQVWDDDNLSGDDLLREVIINGDGTFDSGDFDNGDDSDPFSSRQDVYIRFVAGNGAIHVRDDGTNNLVTIDGPNLGDNISDGLHTLADQVVDGDGPGGYADDWWEAAFEICETATNGWGHYSGLGYNIPRCNFRWRPGSTNGAYYRGSEDTVYLTDGDQYDVSVILHEYGHHVMQKVKGGQPPGSGGAHSWFGCNTIGLAWSEGWATYSGQSTMNSTIYNDSAGVGSSNVVNVNIETTTGNCPDGPGGTTTESSVLSCLWDMFDNLAGDPHPNDYIGVGLGPIWDTFVNGGVFNHVRDYLYAFMRRYGGYKGQVRWWAQNHNITLTSAGAQDLYVDKNYGGEEFGTPEQPFRSVIPAVNVAVGNIRTNINIRANNYNERFLSGKRLVFQRWVNSGVVRIGTP